MRYIAFIFPFLSFSMAFGANLDELKEIKKPSLGETEVPKRLELKQPLPPQPALQERAKARGELSAVAIINPDGTIHKITEITGSPTVIYAYKSYIQGLRFYPTSKSDVGPWVVTLRLICSSTGYNSPTRTTMNIKIINVQDHPVAAN